MVDVKQLEIEHEDQRLVKWFRFGAYSGMAAASEIIKKLPEGRKKDLTKEKV
jgi:hypothetical protein